MRMRTVGQPILTGIALLIWAIPAMAVIRLPEMPVSKIYAGSKQVIVGKVAQVGAENRVVEAEVVPSEAAKGEPAGGRLRVQIVQPEALIKRVAVGQPVIIFVSRSGTTATVHLADTWLVARTIPNAQPPAWRVVQEADLALSFSGRTSDLVEILAGIKRNKPVLLEAFRDEAFRGGVKELAKLGINKPTFLAAADVNGDKKTDLLIGSGGGVQLLLDTDGGFADATEPWGLKAASDPSRAIRHGIFADFNGDGRPDLLLNSTVWLNKGNQFIASDPAEIPSGADVQTVAIGRWGSDGKLSAIAVRKDGLTLHALNAASDMADFHQMTGEKPEALRKAFPNGLKDASLIAADFTGDSYPDCLVLTEDGGLLLVGRGAGAFFINPDAAARLRPSADRPLPFKFTPSLRFTAADLHGDGYAELLVFTGDGVLYEVENPRPQR
ncbi:MAG: FG-GAP repeat domain-containing protein [Bacillota bacterium]